MIATEAFGDIILAVCPIVHDGLSRREAETKAVGSLVSELIGPDCVIAHTPEGAPYVEGSQLNISISHSRDYACMAVSPTQIIGVDIEQARDQLRRVAGRVLSDDELAVYGVSDELLLRAWTLKEALYKAALTPGLDFRREIRLPLSLGLREAVVRDHTYNILSVAAGHDHTLSLVAKK